MDYTHEIEQMCVVAKGPKNGPAPIPQEGKWVKAKDVKDISGLTHGVGWCAPQQGACKLTLNVKEGIIQEALIEIIGCSGMTHSAAMAGETNALVALARGGRLVIDLGAHLVGGLEDLGVRPERDTGAGGLTLPRR